MPTPTPSADKFFVYRDDAGQMHVVDTMSRVPEKYRGRVKVTTHQSADPAVEKDENGATDQVLEGAQKTVDALRQDAIKQAKKLQKTGQKRAKTVQREVGDVIPFVKELDLPSVAVGGGLTMGIVLIWSLIKRRGRTVFKVALLVGIVSLFGTAYLGWLRRAAGVGGSGLATPQTIVRDAKKAAGDFQNRIDAQERLLDRIDETPSEERRKKKTRQPK